MHRATFNGSPRDVCIWPKTYKRPWPRKKDHDPKESPSLHDVNLDKNCRKIQSRELDATNETKNTQDGLGELRNQIQVPPRPITKSQVKKFQLAFNLLAQE